MKIPHYSPTSEYLYHGDNIGKRMNIIEDMEMPTPKNIHILDNIILTPSN